MWIVRLSRLCVGEIFYICLGMGVRNAVLVASVVWIRYKVWHKATLKGNRVMTKAETISHIEAFAARKLEEHGLDELGWTFKWNRRKRSIGVCTYAFVPGIGGTIAVSSNWVCVAPVEKLEDTVLHEMAHAIAGPRAGHGPAWKRACKLVGAEPTRCYKADGLDPGYTWAQLCPSCGKGNRYFSKPSTRNRHSCGVCSGGVFNEEFLLVTKKIGETV